MMSLLTFLNWFGAADKVSVESLPHVAADSNTIANIISIVLTITGGVALLIITAAGLRYILAQGDPEGTAQAKNTIIYALIGLIVSASALVIVNFALKGL